MKISAILGWLVVGLLSPLSAYSESGHRVVGALADKLIEGKPADATVKKLLGAVTLERATGKNSDSLKPHDWAIQLAAKEPADWKLNPALKPEQWSEKWADEILPLALEAHTRLRFLPLEEFDHRNGKPVMSWTAVQKPHHGKSNYAVFASKAVEVELNKAGWRLAALLEASVPAK